MPYLEIALEKKENELREIIEKVQASKKKNIKGNIKVRKTDPLTIYFRQTKEQPYQYMQKSQFPLAFDIMQRDYEKKLLQAAEEQLKMVQKLRSQYNSEKLGKLYEEANPCRKEHLDPYWLSENDYAKWWQQRKYPSRNLMPVININETKKKEIVRSKSEKIIADMLNDHGIPYLYEFPLVLNPYRTVYPDFTILNKRTREVYLLEHLGWLESPDYVRKNLVKLTEYQIFRPDLGRNLLLSGEMDGSHLNIRLIESYIKNYLT